MHLCTRGIDCRRKDPTQTQSIQMAGKTNQFETPVHHQTMENNIMVELDRYSIPRAWIFCMGAKDITQEKKLREQTSTPVVIA